MHYLINQFFPNIPLVARVRVINTFRARIGFANVSYGAKSLHLRKPPRRCLIIPDSKRRYAQCLRCHAVTLVRKVQVYQQIREEPEQQRQLLDDCVVFWIICKVVHNPVRFHHVAFYQCLLQLKPVKIFANADIAFHQSGIYQLMPILRSTKAASIICVPSGRPLTSFSSSFSMRFMSAPSESARICTTLGST